MHHGSHHFQDGPVKVLCYPILLWGICIHHLIVHPSRPQPFLKFYTYVFATSISSQKISLFLCFYFRACNPLLQNFGSLIFAPDRFYPDIMQETINERHEISTLGIAFNVKRSTDIRIDPV